MYGRPNKYYSVWANDKFDTLIALDEKAEVCAELMGIKKNVFYQYLCRPNKAWTIIETKGRKSNEYQKH